MENRNTLTLGIVLLVIGLICAWVFRVYVLQVVAGVFALAVLLAGALMLYMGMVEKNENEAQASIAAAEAKRAAEMAAKA